MLQARFEKVLKDVETLNLAVFTNFKKASTAQKTVNPRISMLW